MNTPITECSAFEPHTPHLTGNYVSAAISPTDEPGRVGPVYFQVEGDEGIEPPTFRTSNHRRMPHPSEAWPVRRRWSVRGPPQEPGWCAALLIARGLHRPPR